MKAGEEQDSTSILTINVGSSSLKVAVFRDSRRVASGAFDRLGTPDCTWSAQIGPERIGGSLPTNSPSGILAVLERILSGRQVTAIAHRIVHGGERFHDHCVVERETLTSLRELTPLAPEHLPQEIHFLEIISSHFRETPSVACFDTVFHQTLPEVARTYALPISVRLSGVRRFGFHGLSFAWLVRVLHERDNCRGRSVLAHLGNGASMAAVMDGKSVDTTMGLTPAAGLVMGTRCGDTDPGLFRILADRFGLDASGIDGMLNHQSGLAGLSGIGSDLRDISQAAETSHQAALSLEVFCHVAKKHAAGMAASLGGIERLVFSGGVGEHAAGIRAAICDGLSFLGIRLDKNENERNSPTISAADSLVEVLVIPADEEAEMAQIAARLTHLYEPVQNSPTHGNTDESQ